MAGCGFGIYVYLDKHKLIEIIDQEIEVGPSMKGEFLERALTWYIKISNNMVEEVIFLFILLSAVILPQILSFLISGLFGCGRPPIFVSSIAKFALLSLKPYPSASGSPKCCSGEGES
jgi:hypothetical protein